MAIGFDEADRAYARALGAGREMLATPYSPAHRPRGRESPAQRSSLSGGGWRENEPVVRAYGVPTDTAGEFESLTATLALALTLSVTLTLGNFEKEGMRRKPSAAQASAQASPFAVDGGQFGGAAGTKQGWPADDRFLTSSSTIGSGVAWAPDRAFRSKSGLPEAVPEGSRPQSAVVSKRPQAAGVTRHIGHTRPAPTALVPFAGERSMWQPHRAFSAAAPSV